MNLAARNVNFTYTCINLPPKINSAGLEWQFGGNLKDYQWLDFTTPRIMLLIATMFTLAQAFHFVLKRFGLPIFISQILAGLALSESVLKLVDLVDIVITKENMQLIGSLGNIGFALFMFLSGVKMDATMLSKAGRKAWYIGILSVAAPLALHFGLSIKYDSKGGPGFFVTPAYYITSFPVVISLLTHLKILNSEIGRLAQSSAIVADFASYASVLFMTFQKLVRVSPRKAFLEFAAVLLYIIVVIFVVQPVMRLIVRMTPEGKQVSQTGLSVVMLILLVFLRSIPKFFTEFRVMGLYILGLAVPHGPPLGSTLVNKFDCLVSGLFLPLFVTSSAMRVKDLSPGSFYNKNLVKNIGVASGTILVKFTACLLPLLYWKVHKNDAIALALIMNIKGIVEMAYYTFESDQQESPPLMFRFMLLVVMAMGSIVAIYVKRLYNPRRKYAGYQIKKILDCNPDSELQIVSCIHVPNNISSTLNFLSISCPRRQSPVVVNVLHLIKLNGQATAIFVSHQKKTRNTSAYSYSENVINSFRQFEELHEEAVSINAFTSVCPMDFMHDDICTLALDKLASLIILPFHRTWYIDGSLESEDQTIRNLNRVILEKAPCSVGILIDHGQRKRPIRNFDTSSESSSYDVAMLFLGGKDDREALAFARRMARDNKFRLAVVHCIAASDDGEVRWETILDSELLREVKSSGHIKYVAHVVKDGSETLQIVASMVNDFNLIIVGRRCNVVSPQTACLQEWSEFPELGILGDLLSSKDLGGNCSVLIMQQQQLV